MRKGNHILTFVLIASMTARAGSPSSAHVSMSATQAHHLTHPVSHFRFPESKFLDAKLEALADFFLTKIVPDEHRRLDSVDEEMDHLYGELEGSLIPGVLASDELHRDKFLELVRQHLSPKPSARATKLLGDFARATRLSKKELAKEMSDLFATGEDRERLFVDRLVWAHYLQLFKKALPSQVGLTVSVPKLIAMLDDYLREPEEAAAGRITTLVELLGPQPPEQLMQIVNSVLGDSHDWDSSQKPERVATLNYAFRYLNQEYKVAEVCRNTPQKFIDSCEDQASHGIKLATHIRDTRKRDQEKALGHLRALIDVQVEQHREGSARLTYKKRELSPAEASLHLEALRDMESITPLLSALGDKIAAKDNPWGVDGVDPMMALFTAWEEPDRAVHLTPPAGEKAPAAPAWARRATPEAPSAKNAAARPVTPPTPEGNRPPAAPETPGDTKSSPAVAADKGPVPVPAGEAPPAASAPAPGNDHEVVARSAPDLAVVPGYDDGRSILDETATRAPRTNGQAFASNNDPTPNYGPEFRLPPTGKPSPTPTTVAQASPTPAAEPTERPAAGRPAAPPASVFSSAPPAAAHRDGSKAVPRSLPFSAPRTTFAQSEKNHGRGASDPAPTSAGGAIEQVSRQTAAPAFQAMPNYRNESAVAAVAGDNSRRIRRETASTGAETAPATTSWSTSGASVAPVLGSVASSPFPTTAAASDVRSARRPASSEAAATSVSVPGTDYGKPGMNSTFTERKERFVADKAAPGTGDDSVKGIEETREITAPSKRSPELTEKVVEKIVRNKNVTRITRKIYERDARGVLVGLTDANIEVHFSYEGTTETEVQVKRDPTTLEEKEIVRIVRFKQAGKVLSEDTTVTRLKKPNCPISKVQTIDPKSYRANKTVITTTYNASCQEVSTVKTSAPQGASAEPPRATAAVTPSVSIKVPKRMPQALFGP